MMGHFEGISWKSIQTTTLPESLYPCIIKEAKRVVGVVHFSLAFINTIKQSLLCSNCAGSLYFGRTSSSRLPSLQRTIVYSLVA